MEGEKFNIVLWDDDIGSTDDPVKTITIDFYNDALIPVILDSSMNEKIGNYGKIYIKVTAPN